MPNTFDFTSQRIKKMLEDKQGAQQAMRDLLKDIKSAHQSHQLIEFFSLKCLEVNSAEELFIMLDDFFIGELNIDWYLHFPTERVGVQLTHNMRPYSQRMARKYISHTVVEGKLIYKKLSGQAAQWLIGKEVEPSGFRILPLGKDIQQGFIALRITETSVDLGAPTYSYIGRACQIMLSRLLA